MCVTQPHPHQPRDRTPLAVQSSAPARWWPARRSRVSSMQQPPPAGEALAAAEPDTDGDPGLGWASQEGESDEGPWLDVPSEESGDDTPGASGTSSSESGDDPGPSDAAAEGGRRVYDPSTSGRHEYLGDVEDLQGSNAFLPAGTTARLPLLVLEGVVLFPGCQLPLLLNSHHELHMLDQAMGAPPPLTRLVAVLAGPRSLPANLSRLVACTAEVRQLQRRPQDDSGSSSSVAVVTLGRQRAEVVPERSVRDVFAQVSVEVRILDEGCCTSVPAPVRACLSSIHPALARPWDLQLLVSLVQQALQHPARGLAPLAGWHGSPLELSYHVAHNLPLQPATRQRLLASSCASDRLRLLLRLLEGLDRLCCCACGRQVATAAEVLVMTSEGIGGAFVNSAGFVHDLISVSHAGALVTSEPETAHSWFQGWAWSIANCPGCGQHLGWRFTAVQRALKPRVFWGLRRNVLMCVDADAAAAGIASEHEEEGAQQQAGGGRGPGVGPRGGA